MAARQKDKAGQSKVRLSKSLAWLLRHNAESEGFTFMEGGYLPVEDVLKHKRFTGFTLTDVEEVVKNCDKQRYTLAVGDDIINTNDISDTLLALPLLMILIILMLLV